jgi:hypothetical protein
MTSSFELMFKFPSVKKLQLTPWTSDFFEKLVVSQLVKIFPTFYGNERFFIASTSRRVSPSSRPDKSNPSPDLISSIQYHAINI